VRTPKHNPDRYPESIAWQAAILVLMCLGAVVCWAESKMRGEDE